MFIKHRHLCRKPYMYIHNDVVSSVISSLSLSPMHAHSRSLPSSSCMCESISFCWFLSNYVTWTSCFGEKESAACTQTKGRKWVISNNNDKKCLAILQEYWYSKCVLIHNIDILIWSIVLQWERLLHLLKWKHQLRSIRLPLTFWKLT